VRPPRWSTPLPTSPCTDWPRPAGRPDVAGRALARSASWRHLLDPATGRLAPRAADGSWVPHDPAGCCTGFEEGSAVQYTWGSVLHDRAGLLTELGDADAVLARLADFFTELDAGAGGRAWIGNQPSFAAPWTYLWLGRPDLTQDVVDRIRATWSAEPEGLPGNDDLGSTSAWFVWMSLGLQPLVPGTAVTAVGVPAFDRVVVRPRRGPSTTLVRTGGGRHVASVLVDGRPLSRSWASWGPGSRPREVAVTTAGSPSAWGTRPTDLPPSWPDDPAG
jgi:putative alpha-1,2-mannosidase